MGTSTSRLGSLLAREESYEHHTYFIGSRFAKQGYVYLLTPAVAN